MGRRPKGIAITCEQEQELRRRLEDSSTNRWEKERLRTLLEAAQGTYTLDELAKRNRRSRSTIQNWLAKYQSGGIAGLLNHPKPRGTASPVGSEEIQNQLKQGVAQKRWRSAVDVAQWLKTEHGITRSPKSVYYWLAKNGFGWRALQESIAPNP